MNAGRILVVKIAIAAALTLSAGGAIALVVPLPGAPRQTAPPIPSPTTAQPVRGLGEGGVGIQPSTPSPSPAPSPSPGASLALACSLNERDPMVPTECTVTSLNGFAGPLTFSCPNLARTLYCSFDHTQATIGPGGVAKFRMILFPNPPPQMPPRQNVQVRAASGKISVTITTPAGGSWEVSKPTTLPRFELSCPYTGYLTVVAGRQTQVGCTVASFNGFNAPVQISCEDSSHILQCSPAPAQVIPPPNGTAAVSVLVTAPKSESQANAALAIQAQSDAGIHFREPEPIDFLIEGLGFRISCMGTVPYNPATGDSCQASPVSEGVYVGMTTWACSVENVPGASCVFSPATVDVKEGTGGTTYFFVDLPPGTYTVDITAKSDLYTETVKASVIMRPRASPSPGPSPT